jgi:DNA-binding NarL/FixJ family response regulator
MQITKLPQFTVRESDTLHLLAQGYSRRRIAERLNISYSTVDSHLSSISKKTGVRGLPELICYAQDRGFGKQSPRITEALTPLHATKQNSETV